MGMEWTFDQKSRNLIRASKSKTKKRVRFKRPSRISNIRLRKTGKDLKNKAYNFEGDPKNNMFIKQQQNRLRKQISSKTLGSRGNKLNTKL